MNLFLLEINIVKVLAPLGVLLALAVLFALLLSYLGKILSVERDSKIDEVRGCLSGANCGGCGFAGCDALAEAIVKGEAKVNACPSMTKESAQKIAEILGVSGEGMTETICVVRCNGGNACKDKADYLGYGDCRSCEVLNGGTKECPYGCMGLASCSRHCNYHAADVKENGVCVIDPHLCTSCGVCIKECPKGLIERIPKDAAIYVACKNVAKGKDVMSACKNGCIGCGLCAKNCVVGAITMENNLPVIDYSKCVKCMVCVGKCPTKVLKKVWND